ncbi:MAG: hypothetical protein KF799_08970 [Bdellovibrionales bacterium]|nr:hypothetical protein [Bdellovibrionales bacterium]
MKTYIITLVLTVLTLITTSAPAFAVTEGLRCTAGEVGEDNFLEISIGRNQVTFNLYESSFAVPRSRVQYRGDTFAILSEEVVVNVEGGRTKSKIDALAVYQPGSGILILTLLVDNYSSLPAVQMQCSS